ncbi:uncharacterized protein LOC110343956 [Heterocephalus glaber]|uniref:Uncharacterized protein LOC110343956 n=1 Tax=Heterocephalus glaber TaxID=10181 RepID=A0AAX6R847_HETGA|nr:uncharacterized protein LOC110343956 [Heterocephalus glaber]
MTPWHKTPQLTGTGPPLPRPVPTAGQPQTCLQGIGRGRRQLRRGGGQVLRRLFGPGILFRRRRLQLLLGAGRDQLLLGVLGRRTPRRWRSRSPRLPGGGAPGAARLVRLVRQVQRQVQRQGPHGHGPLRHAAPQHRGRRRLAPRPRAEGGRGALRPRRLSAVTFRRGRLLCLAARRPQPRLPVGSHRGRVFPRGSGGHRGASGHGRLAPAGRRPGPGSPAVRLSTGAPAGSGPGQKTREPAVAAHRGRPAPGVPTLPASSGALTARWLSVPQRRTPRVRDTRPAPQPRASLYEPDWSSSSQVGPARVAKAVTHSGRGGAGQGLASRDVTWPLAPPRPLPAARGGRLQSSPGPAPAAGRGAGGQPTALPGPRASAAQLRAQGRGTLQASVTRGLLRRPRPKGGAAAHVVPGAPGGRRALAARATLATGRGG